MMATPARALFLIAPLVAACATTPPPEPQPVAMPVVNLEAEEQAIRARANEMAAAARAGNASKTASFYAEDAVFLPAHMPIVRGRGAITTAWTDMLKTPGLNLTFEPTRITVAESGDLAEDVGTYRMTVQSPQGTYVEDGKYVVVWKKVNGEWRISSDIYNPDKMPPPPPAPVSTAHGAFDAKEMTWNPGPASLPSGVQLAVLEGNPAEPGPFTIRLKASKLVTIPPHTHPGVEHVTVISGHFHIGHGATADWKAAKRLDPGGFTYLPPNTPHFAQLGAGAEIQLHGVGPWAVNYLNPADDPRNKTP